MFGMVRKMSLRTRLALLAGFAVLALSVALIVAWRLARVTETFTHREADAAVHNAARDLARELRQNPSGYTTLAQASPSTLTGKHERPAAPPHVNEIFTAYSDPLVRLTAITIHRYQNVDGGFYDSAATRLVGETLPSTTSSSVLELVQRVAQQASSTGMPASEETQIGSDRIIAAAYPIDGDSTITAWSVKRLSFYSGLSDWPNFIALVALGISFVAVCGLALITVKDLRRGVSQIEAGLGSLKQDLNQQVAAPETKELRAIADAVNELSQSLRTNLERQRNLERQLRRSERLSSLGRVVAGVAHEVRNPLSAIKLKAQLAQRSLQSDDKLSETFNVIRAEIERLDSLVRRLLDLGGQQSIKRTPVDPHSLIAERVALFTEIAKATGVIISTDELRSDITISGDQQKLAQVFDNIIQNALEAMPQGGELAISSDVVSNQNSESARLTFSDTGQGISETDQSHIFEPFYTGRSNGTGLGLAIARGIVDEHGGEISFVSRTGYGSSFVVYLPVTLNLRQDT
jgi:signal transduction histidine kinase